MSPVNLLVTGHMGYLGSALAPMLIGKGYEVVGVDRSEVLPVHRQRPFGMLSADDLIGYDTVIHLAGVTDDAQADADPRLATRVNVGECGTLAAKSKQAGVRRFILASTCAVYGRADGVCDELTDPNPQSHYAKTKLAAEALVRALAGPDFSVICLRFGSSFGWTPSPRFNLALNKFAASALADGKVALHSDGHAVRPFVHANDIARAITHSVELPEDLPTATFNVVHPEGNLTMGDAAEILCDLLGVPAPSFGTFADRRSYRCSTAALTETGFDYQWDLERGLADLGRWLRHSTDTPVPHAGSVGLVTPAQLGERSAAGFTAEVADINRRGTYRVAGGHRDVAAALVSELFQTQPSQGVAMVRSGTDALVRALQLVGVKAADRVVVPDLAFHAVGAAVISLGAVPIFADVNADDFNMSVESTERLIIEHAPSAFIAVDNYGTPADWTSFSALARQHNVPFILDACESIGARRGAASCAHQADIVVCSFSFTKPVHGAGMGGALVADRELLDELANRPELLAKQVALPELNAAYLVRMWPTLDDNIARLRATYDAYGEALTQFGFVPQAEHGVSTRIHAPFLCPDGWSRSDRDRLIASLNQNGVGAAAQFPSQSQLFAAASDCPVSAYISDRVVSLPSGVNLSTDLAARVTRQTTDLLAAW